MVIPVGDPGILHVILRSSLIQYSIRIPHQKYQEIKDQHNIDIVDNPCVSKHPSTHTLPRYFQAPRAYQYDRYLLSLCLCIP